MGNYESLPDMIGPPKSQIQKPPYNSPISPYRPKIQNSYYNSFTPDIIPQPSFIQSSLQPNLKPSESLCTDCLSIQKCNLDKNTNAFKKLERFVCEKCFNNYCCYKKCYAMASYNCPICKSGFCWNHKHIHSKTFKINTIDEITSYSCDICRANLVLYEADFGYSKFFMKKFQKILDK